MANLDDDDSNQHLRVLLLWKKLQRLGHDMLYQTIMRNGGAPFGRPFDIGTTTLTSRLVRRLRQRGFFHVETIESLQQSNKFTRYGAAPYKGKHALVVKNAAPLPQHRLNIVNTIRHYVRKLVRGKTF